jgi:hypothetical protein
MSARPSRFRPAGRSLTLGAALATVGLLAAACGGASPSSAGVATVGASSGSAASPAAATTPTSRLNALQKAAQCMRSNGVPTFPDPTVDSNGNARLTGLRSLDRNDPVTAAARKACLKYFTAARPTFTPQQQQQLQNALLAFARCVRQHGYNMPDPTFNGGSGAGPGGRGVFGSVNRNDPLFQKARKACQPLLAGVRLGGGGGGGGGFFGGGAGG